MKVRVKDITDERVLNVRKKVLQVFKDLRRKGYITLANFACCQTCAQTILINRVTSLSIEKAAKVRGCAFWQQQDESFFRRHKVLRLSYGPIYSPVHGLVGDLPAEVGNLLVNELRAKGLKVEWSGIIRSKINVIA
jgi:hypothetical protein